jgi:hypothetical protein
MYENKAIYNLSLWIAKVCKYDFKVRRNMNIFSKYENKPTKTGWTFIQLTDLIVTLCKHAWMLMLYVNSSSIFVDSTYIIIWTSTSC